MKHFTNCDTDYIYIYLLTHEYFKEEELNLCTKAFGDNINTYDKICQVRYALDFDQIWYYDQEEKL